jgi:eukaryotic-like serine/threonine-protein kinase
VVGELIVDRYELEEVVGTGGMSSVYRAHDRLLERDVALKVLHDQFGEDGEHVERFRHEARVVAALSHPNIVTVIDRGEQNGRQFIVFEYVAGENLKSLIQREAPLAEHEAVELGLQIARALAFAHDHGLCHRDVKPQNVLLGDGAEAKVTDFGIARSLDVRDGITQTGTVLGTSDYIAPEQARGSRATVQTDIYSLGVVLYELLTGELPFRGENFVAVAMRHINDPVPSVRALRPDVSPRLDAAIQRAMAKEPRQRFGSMDEFAAELEACLAHPGANGAGPGDETLVVAPAPPTDWRSRRAARPPVGRPTIWPLILLLAGLAVLGGIFAIAFAITGSPTDFSGAVHKAGLGKAAASKPVHLVGAASYDPQGDNRVEHSERVRLAADGSSQTYWETEHYSGGLNKNGVGVVLDAGKARKLSQVTVTTDTDGYTAEIEAGSSAGGPFTPVSGSQVVNGTVVFKLHGAAARYYVVWITDLGSNSSVHVNEVTAKS